MKAYYWTIDASFALGPVFENLSPTLSRANFGGLR
jgi:hypothetical protein